MDPLQIDRTGVLQKWSKNIRRWQPRFVRTQRSYLMYYKYKGAPPPADADPDQMINLKEITKVVKHAETMTFELFNAQGEKVLALKADTEREYKGWVEAVEAKVIYMQEKGDEEDEELESKFQTNAFTMLSLMGDAEVDEFANDSLNEIFREGDGSLEDTIHAAEKVLHVMEDVCEDYLSELRAASGSASERRVIVLCDRLFVQYYTGIQNRLVLELGSTMGPSLLTMEHLMEKPVTVSADIFNFLEQVEAFYTKYAPLVRPSTKGQQVSSIASLGGLKAFLPTQDLLTSAIISIAIRDVEQMWLQESERYNSRAAPTRRPSLSLAGLDLSGSGNRGVDVPPPRFSVVLDAMSDIFGAVRIENQDKVTNVRAKVFTSCVLYLAGCFATLRLPKPDSRGNERFIFNLLKDLSLCPARLSGLRKRYGDEAISPEVAAEFLQASKRFMSDASFLFVDFFLATDEQLPRLLPLLFLHPTWQAGEVTQTIINKFKLFLSSKVDELPPSVHSRFEARVLRGFMLRYLSQFFNAIRPVRLSFDDIMRFLDDETKIKEWVELGRWHDPSARLDQLWLLKWIRIFLLMPVSETLSMYSEALLISHPSVAPHLYDVLRYCLKLRPDLSAADYHPALATCHEYIKQHDGASMVASPLPLTPAVELLKELLPKAGVMHCTGKPWAYEEASQHSQSATVASVANLAIKNSTKAHRMRREDAASTQNGTHPTQVANQPAPFILAAVPPPLAKKAAAPGGVLYEPPKPPPSPEEAQAGDEEVANPFSPEDEEEGGTGSPGSEQPAGSPAISPLRDEEDGSPSMADQPAPDATASTSSPPSASPTDVPVSWETKVSPASSAGASSPPPRPKTASPVKAPPARPQEAFNSPAIASPALTSPAMVSSPALQSDGISSPDGRSVGSSVSGGSPTKGAKKRHSISVVRGITAFVKGKKKDKDKTEGQEVISPEPLTPPEGAGADKEDGKKPPKAKRSMSSLFGGRRNSAPPKPSPTEGEGEDANPFSDDQASPVKAVPSTSAAAVEEVANPFEDDDEEDDGLGSPAPPVRPTSHRDAQPLPRPLSTSTQSSSRRMFGGGMVANPPTSPAVTSPPPPRPSRYAAPPPPPQRPVQPARRVFGAPIPVEAAPASPVLPPAQQHPPPQQPRQQPPRQQPPTEEGGRGFAGRRAGDWW